MHSERHLIYLDSNMLVCILQYVILFQESLIATMRSIRPFNSARPFLILMVMSHLLLYSLDDDCSFFLIFLLSIFCPSLFGLSTNFPVVTSGTRSSIFLVVCPISASSAFAVFFFCKTSLLADEILLFIRVLFDSSLDVVREG